MKYKISPQQFKLLDGFTIVQNHGLVQNGDNLIKESKMPEYLVTMYVLGHPAKIRISGFSRGAVLSIAKALFPRATITGLATLIR